MEAVESFEQEIGPFAKAQRADGDKMNGRGLRTALDAVKSPIRGMFGLLNAKPGITFMQFGSEANPFASDPGWQAYHALMKNSPDFNAASKTRGCQEFKGKTLPNYKMWGDNWIDSNNPLDQEFSSRAILCTNVP